MNTTLLKKRDVRSTAQRRKKAHFPTLVIILLVIPPLALAAYVLSILWRVSLAEFNLYGRSELIPFAIPPRDYSEPPVPASYFAGTFTIYHDGQKLVVWKQKINGFQHMYGSALAAFELNEFLSDKLFCANEFAEYTFDHDGLTWDDLLDRKKDLSNNRIGRAIGLEVKKLNLQGAAAERRIMLKCFEAAEFNPNFLPHFLDARVLDLTEEQLGCPFLPKANLFNFVNEFTGNHKAVPDFLNQKQ